MAQAVYTENAAPAPRDTRALALFAACDHWHQGHTKDGRSFFAIPGSQAGLFHMADQNDCSCPDRQRARNVCKHMRAVRLWVAAFKDVVVTVPARLWRAWIYEGDLPGQKAEYESHFWLPVLPRIEPYERVYIVAHGAIRGYAPLVRTEVRCVLAPFRGCLVRAGGAVAVTVPGLEVVGFRGFRYRWWEREAEVPFPRWKEPTARVRAADLAAQPSLVGRGP